MQNRSIIWLRRDLRIDDNISFFSALKSGALIQPVFIFDQDILNRFDNKNDQRITFLAETICSLGEKIRSKGAELLVFFGVPGDIIPLIAKDLEVQEVFAGQDFEEYGIKRDEFIQRELKKSNIDFILQNDHLLNIPQEVLKPDSTPYKVFTPYSKVWLQKIYQKDIEEYKYEDDGRYFQSCNKLSIKKIDITKGPEYLLQSINYNYSPNNFFSYKSANFVLENFINNKVSNYADNRNFVYKDSTSKLSPYLRFGLVSVRKCYRLASLQENTFSFINELIWRDFYASIMYFFPKSISEEFLPQYRKLKWNEDKEALEKWKKGETGFPIIDAAMIQLKSEGWMHNRARMIVASFLTKHLLIDWRRGEEHFAQLLMDYELSSNVGGWQWAASVGTDAQPYFRIFNPYTQSKNFDPVGIYIKKYISSLQNIPTKFIHEPHKFLTLQDYPKPIIDHDFARKRALAFFSFKIGNSII